MLIRDFYTIGEITNDADLHTVKVTLNAGHAVYNGHFPGQPVLPGACSLQIIKECAEYAVNKDLRYSEIQSCKYLSVINPIDDNVLEIRFNCKESENGIKLTADVDQKEQPVIKLKAVLTVM
ncbi:MAG: hydroxymyristoyl-ACP dehydratase [Prevotellaceae bacterium]|jgi:3-hydroxyacyl-[acyl-carrier-protein] dehydratase|nr:hydroxymyristoyl-ACP dehydratase [Prevotellaceae bacterium]